MSSKANIKFTDGFGEILLYKHHNGYPDTNNGVVESMQPYFYGHIDMELLASRLIREADYEVAACIHKDISFYYEVNVTTKTIFVFQVDIKTGKRTFLNTVKADGVVN